MHDIIYEIQYRHHVQRRLLHEKESRVDHLLCNLYSLIYLEITLIFLNIYRTIQIIIER